MKHINHKAVIGGELGKQVVDGYLGKFKSNAGTEVEVKNIMAVMTDASNEDSLTCMMEGGFSPVELMMALTAMQEGFISALVQMGRSETDAMEMLADSAEMAMEMFIQKIVDREAL
jgi:hypothetical protein